MDDREWMMELAHCRCLSKVIAEKADDNAVACHRVVACSKLYWQLYITHAVISVIDFTISIPLRFSDLILENFSIFKSPHKQPQLGAEDRYLWLLLVSTVIVPWFAVLRS